MLTFLSSRPPHGKNPINYDQTKENPPSSCHSAAVFSTSPEQNQSGIALCQCSGCPTLRSDASVAIGLCAPFYLFVVRLVWRSRKKSKGGPIKRWLPML